MENLTLNDGGGLFDKYGMIDEMVRKMEALADAKGAFRCGLIWDVEQMMIALKNGLKSEDEENQKLRKEFVEYVRERENA